MSLPGWITRRHAKIVECTPATVDGEEGYLGWSHLVYSKIWFDTESASHTIARVSYGPAEAIYRRLVSGDVQQLQKASFSTAVACASADQLPPWASRRHGSIKCWAWMTVDGEDGVLGVSSLVYSKLWFDTKDASRTIVTGTQAECEELFREIANETHWVGGAISEITLPILSRALSGLSPNYPILDFHVHCVGMQHAVTGCCLHDAVTSWSHPVNKAKQLFFMRGLGVTDLTDPQVDVHMVDRLVRLVEGIEKHFYPITYQCLVLPFDAVYTEEGVLDRDRSAVVVPNDHVFAQCERYPSKLIPACSVHPYRKDAVDELQRCYERGARVVKWLPNTQYINPASPLCTPFYQAMHRLGMTLLCHVGDEHSITFCGVANKLGNPLLLRSALDHHVRVVMAHCASEGYNEDLDSDFKSTENFDLFLRMMGEERYKDLLFADISALSCFRRLPYFIKVLDTPSIHPRLVYGSDYPVPCVPLVVQTSKLAGLGLLTSAEAQLIDVIKESNPLLANLAILRLAASPTSRRSLPPCVFHGLPTLLSTPPSTPDSRAE
eukprot:Sspe_Gene.119846::Locus_116940_Transcript_1_1_Confidence_1.000_Length_1785::g.119846::m.119846